MLLVAPLVGARIEIQMTVKEALDATSLPSWERGLKYVGYQSISAVGSSLPSWERGLKYLLYITIIVNNRSLPSWERGLKSITLTAGEYYHAVAPLVGARIEI